MRDYSLQHRLELARVVLETETPLSISEGHGDGLLDNQIVRDANGLPGLPGSSSAGALRSMVHKCDAALAQSLFGSAIGDSDHETASRVHVSWGCLHDSNDQPVEGLLLGKDAQARMQQDPLLADALKDAPIKRERVRINHLGCAAGQGLFNRVALTAGHRFSFELSFRHAGEESQAWQQLLSLLVDPAFRLGGGTRSGFGALKLVRIHHSSFDLSSREDLQRLGALSPSIGDVSGLTPLRLPTPPSALVCQLTLAPCDYFRIGQGFEPLESADENEPKLIPISEQRVQWRDNQGALQERKVLLPATALKGAIRHRLAYHDRVLAKCFADINPPEDWEAEANQAVRNLFGFASDQDDNKDLSHCGHVVLDDLFLDQVSVLHMTHNVIDAYTGGVRKHLLFSEEVVGCKSPITLKLTILDGAQVAPRTRDALQRTLCDLVEGRLALGSGSGRGLGFFTGTMTWSDGGRWIEGEA